MFARTVSMRLKPNGVAEFNKTLENEILPVLRKQTGFQDELVLVSSNGTEVIGISLWDQKDSAEAYHRTAYSEVQKVLSKVIEGTPQVQTYEVSSSTIHKASAAARR
jgi:heme-degrading monooxygenase HmoA